MTASIDLAAHDIGLQPADRVRHDQALKVAQPALLGLELKQVGEGARADGDRGDAELFEEDCGVDTPRRAGSSITRPNQQEVGPLGELRDRRIRRRAGDRLAAEGELTELDA